jgi:transcriptional regulator with XRE-family HTH domain
MTTPTDRAFNEWLRVELRARRMSQRQLAQRSGVAHSTISRARAVTDPVSPTGRCACR